MTCRIFASSTRLEATRSRHRWSSEETGSSNTMVEARPALRSSARKDASAIHRPSPSLTTLGSSALVACLNCTWRVYRDRYATASLYRSPRRGDRGARARHGLRLPLLATFPYTRHAVWLWRRAGLVLPEHSV